MEELFDRIESEGLISRQGVEPARIARLSTTRIIDLAQELADITPLPEVADGQLASCHCASISLGGGREDCGVPECRMQRLEESARFAAFYSDRVYIRSFFSDYPHLKRLSDDELRANLITDVALRTEIRPLLEQGIMQLVSVSGHLCPDCLGSAMGLGPRSGGSVLRALRGLSRDFFDNTSLALELQGEWAFLSMSGPKPYYEHGGRGSIRRGCRGPSWPGPRSRSDWLTGNAWSFRALSAAS